MPPQLSRTDVALWGAEPRGSNGSQLQLLRSLFPVIKVNLFPPPRPPFSAVNEILSADTMMKQHNLVKPPSSFERSRRSFDWLHQTRTRGNATRSDLLIIPLFQIGVAALLIGGAPG